MDIFQIPSVWLIFKAIFIAGILVYLVFALVVVKQVRIMNQTLDVGLEGFMTFFSYLHLAFAIFVLVAALITL